MTATSTYAVVRERDGALRLTSISGGNAATIAIVKPALDRTGHPAGWRLKPLVVLRGPTSRVWTSAAEAIASTKLMTVAQARAAIAAADTATRLAAAP